MNCTILACALLQVVLTTPAFAKDGDEILRVPRGKAVIDVEPEVSDNRKPAPPKPLALPVAPALQPAVSRAAKPAGSPRSNDIWDGQITCGDCAPRTHRDDADQCWYLELHVVGTQVHIRIDGYASQRRFLASARPGKTEHELNIYFDEYAPGEQHHLNVHRKGDLLVTLIRQGAVQPPKYRLAFRHLLSNGGNRLIDCKREPTRG